MFLYSLRSLIKTLVIIKKARRTPIQCLARGIELLRGLEVEVGAGRPGRDEVLRVRGGYYLHRLLLTDGEPWIEFR